MARRGAIAALSGEPLADEKGSEALARCPRPSRPGCRCLLRVAAMGILVLSSRILSATRGIGSGAAVSRQGSPAAMGVSKRSRSTSPPKPPGGSRKSSSTRETSSPPARCSPAWTPSNWRLSAGRPQAQLHRAVVSVDTAKSLVTQREAERNAAIAVVAQREAQLDAAQKKARPIAEHGQDRRGLAAGARRRSAPRSRARKATVQRPEGPARRLRGRHQHLQGPGC